MKSKRGIDAHGCISPTTAAQHLHGHPTGSPLGTALPFRFRSFYVTGYVRVYRPLGPICTEICREKWALASRLSRSLNVIGTDTDRSATYDFLLVIHSNHGLISYRFPDKRRFRSKIPINFPTQCVDNVPVDGVPLECCNGSGAQNARMVENI